MRRGERKHLGGGRGRKGRESARRETATRRMRRKRVGALPLSAHVHCALSETHCNLTACKRFNLIEAYITEP